MKTIILLTMMLLSEISIGATSQLIKLNEYEFSGCNRTYHDVVCETQNLIYKRKQSFYGNKSTVGFAECTMDKRNVVCPDAVYSSSMYMNNKIIHDE
jgi:hypothetical protein